MSSVVTKTETHVGVEIRARNDACATMLTRVCATHIIIVLAVQPVKIVLAVAPIIVKVIIADASIEARIRCANSSATFTRFSGVVRWTVTGEGTDAVSTSSPIFTGSCSRGRIEWFWTRIVIFARNWCTFIDVGFTVVPGVPRDAFTGIRDCFICTIFLMLTRIWRTQTWILIKVIKLI